MITVPGEHIALMKQQGWWGEQTLDDLLRQNIEAGGEGEALVDAPNLETLAGMPQLRLRWCDIEPLLADRVALLHAAGLRQDDVVIVQLPNSVEMTLFYLACFRLGIIVSPVPVQYRRGELRRLIDRTDAKAVITAARIGSHHHAESLLALMDECPSLETVFSFGDAPEGAVNIQSALAGQGVADRAAAAAAVLAAAVGPDDVATVCWTSGTEAEPKGVPRSHNEWLFIGRSIVHGANLEQGTRILNPFPMVNMAGIATGMLNWLLVGGVLVLHHPFDLGVMLGQLRDEKIGYTIAPPAVLNTMLNNSAMLSGLDFGVLRKIGSGSAPLSEWMVKSFHGQYGVEIINFFGSNEGASLLASAADVPDAGERAYCFPRLGSHGFTWSYPYAAAIETKIVDLATGEDITEAETPGELRLKGASVFSGYWRDQDATNRAFDEDGWFCSGDMFSITGPEGRYYRFVGRCKDIVVRGGMNISAAEIENYLIAHPDVTDVAVIGAPDQILGERLCACVVAKPGTTMEALNAYLVGEKNVAVFKQIERLELMDQLPRNAVGKVLKQNLRDMLFGGSA